MAAFPEQLSLALSGPARRADAEHSDPEHFDPGPFDPGPSDPEQPDPDTPLAEVTFCIVDLETTGASAATSSITEVGAVRVRGGRVVSELGTLVRPDGLIPDQIVALTGITNAMVADAPSLDAVLPSVLEMMRGAVLVAHNARFDTSFLRAACVVTGLTWPDPPVVDTLALARAVLPRDEVGNHKLSTLAAHLHAATTPSHRALDDARATVDVLHALVARLGSRVRTVADLRARAGTAVPATVRRKADLAADMPSAPGVYLFRDAQGRVLYVGTSRDLRTRVRTYFTAAERRPRMREMVTLAAEVVPVVCATVLEAHVRELRLIADHDPPYNRRSRRPGDAPWLKLTAEAYPRLSIVRTVRADVASGAAYLGPFTSSRAAAAALEAVGEAFALRRCTPRLPVRPAATASACLLAEIGRCGAPCIGGQSRADYARLVDAARRSLTSDGGPVIDASLRRLERLVASERFEEAAAVRDALVAYLRGASRTQRVAPLARSPEIVAGRRVPGGGWELVCVRHGRLAGTTTTPPGADPLPYVSALRASAEDVPTPVEPAAAASAEEVEKVLAWLETDGVRLIHVEGEWSCPVGGAAGVDAEALAAGRLQSLPPAPPEEVP